MGLRLARSYNCGNPMRGEPWAFASFGEAQIGQRHGDGWQSDSKGVPIRRGSTWGGGTTFAAEGCLGKPLVTAIVFSCTPRETILTSSFRHGRRVVSGMADE